jgi:hypothetical protein
MGCLQQSLTAMDPHFDPRTYGNTRSRAIDQVRHVSRCVPGARINPEAGGRRPWDKCVARAWPLAYSMCCPVCPLRMASLPHLAPSFLPCAQKRNASAAKNMRLLWTAPDLRCT